MMWHELGTTAALQAILQNFFDTLTNPLRKGREETD